MTKKLTRLCLAMIVSCSASLATADHHAEPTYAAL